MLSSIFFARLLWKAFVLRRPRRKLFTHAYMVLATGVVVQRVLYLYVTRTTLDVYNCSPSNPPDYDKNGNVIYYMAFNSAIVCYEPGGVHLQLLPFAFFAMAVYVAGLPLLSIWWLRKNKQVIKYDQLLRAQGVGSDKQTNPHFAFRKTFKALYMNYRPGAWGWEFVICVRKFLIAYCSLTFRATSSYQLAMALLVLFVAYMLQVRALPYMSHARAATAVAEHKKKVLEGHAMHVAIEAGMLARAAKYRHSNANGLSAKAMRTPESARSATVTGLDELEAFYALRRSAFERQITVGCATLLRNSVAFFLFDYNTAEAVLLSSAVLVCLAGICFDNSSRFSDAMMQRADVRADYDALASAVIAVIIGSFCFWFLSMIMDLTLVLAPKLVSNFLGRLEDAGRHTQTAGMAGLDAAKKVRDGAKRLAGQWTAASGEPLPLSAAAAAGAPAKSVEEALDPNRTIMFSNELLAKQMERREAALASAAAAAMADRAAGSTMTDNLIHRRGVAASPAGGRARFKGRGRFQRTVAKDPDSTSDSSDDDVTGVAASAPKPKATAAPAAAAVPAAAASAAAEAKPAPAPAPATAAAKAVAPPVPPPAPEAASKPAAPAAPPAPEAAAPSSASLNYEL